MDIGRVLARSLEIAWRYKLLWVLGFVMALTGGNSGNGFSNSFDSSGFGRRTTPPEAPSLLSQIQPAVVIALLAFAVCLWLFFLVLVLYFRFVARGALVTFVRAVENGTTPTLGGAWREGQRYYGRLLGLGFLFNVPLAIFTFFAILVALLPMIGILIGASSQIGRGQISPPDFAPIVSGLFAFLALLCFAVLCLLILQLAVHPVYEFGVRGIVLEESGLLEGLTKGLRRLRLNLGTVALLYLILIGARIGWSIVLTIIGLPFLLVLLAAITAAASAHSAPLVVLAALVLGLPLVLLLAFLEGLFQVFESNAWTEGYLALLALPSPPAPVVPAPGPVASA